MGRRWCALMLASTAGCSLTVDTSGLTGGSPDSSVVDVSITDTSVDSTLEAASDVTTDSSKDASIDSTADSTADAHDSIADATDATDATDTADTAKHCPTGTVAVAAPTIANDYCIDATEVTAAAYQTWLGTSPSTASQPSYCSWNTTFDPQVVSGYPSGWWPPSPAHLSAPVRFIDWCDAHAYCAAHGEYLCHAIGGGDVTRATIPDPTKSQWMRACGGTKPLTYPYGDTYVAGDCVDKSSGLYSYPVAVGSLSTCVGAVSGLHDMSGNIEEWEENCETPATGGTATDQCYTRGGGYGSISTDAECGSVLYHHRGETLQWIGFRCCADPS